MRRAFTLIELLAIVAIIGIMVTAGVVSLGAGQGAARTRGATRDIFATIRQARSTALVTQQPCVLSYSTVTVDGETCAKVEITSARIFSGSSVTEAETLSGERVNLADPNGTAAAAESGDGAGAEDGAGGGQSIEDILFEPIAADVVKGMAIQVKMADELIEVEQNEEKSRSMISATLPLLPCSVAVSRSAHAATPEVLPRVSNTTSTHRFFLINPIILNVFIAFQGAKLLIIHLKTAEITDKSSIARGLSALFNV